MRRTIWHLFLTFAVIIIVFGTLTQVVRKEKSRHYSAIPILYDKVERLHCPKPSFSKTKLPITALASFPGSGNTWLRHLIQSMTGILTGSIYNDTLLRQNGFPGEGVVDGRVVAVKTHLNYTSQSFKRTVLIIRNPYSAFIAEFNRLNTKSHTGSAKIDMFLKQWNPFFKTSLSEYIDFYMTWIKAKNVHLVMYDNLVKDLGSELTRLLKYLRNSTSVVGNVQCALSNSTGEHKRDHSKSAPLEFFYSKDKIIRMNKMINDLYKNYTKRFKKQARTIKAWKLPLQ